MAIVLILCISMAILLKVAYETLSHYYITPRRIKKIMEEQGVSGLRRHFLFGNSSEKWYMICDSFNYDMTNINHNIVGRVLPHYVIWSRKHGNRFIFWKGLQPRMCLTEEQLLREIFFGLKTGRQQHGSKDLIRSGLLMASGDSWRHLRRIVEPAFFQDKLRANVEGTVEVVRFMLPFLANQVEIGEHMRLVSADVISRKTLGCTYRQGRPIFQLLTQLQHLCAQTRLSLVAGLFPSTYNRDLKSLNLQVEKLLREMIQDRIDMVEEIGRSSSYGNDLMGMLLDEMKNRGSSSSSGLSMNMQMILDECKTFLFAGHEGTSLLLTWTVMLLASNPAWQDRVRAEVNQVCHGNPPTADHLRKLLSLNMVIRESLRLYPPFPVLNRMALEDIKLRNGLLIPKGVSIWIPILAMHHSEEIWGQDANEFNPNRFAPDASAEARRHFLPFAAGPRDCPAQYYALMEAKIILAMFISKFRFTISDNYRHAPVTVITLKPKHGVQINLESL